MNVGEQYHAAGWHPFPLPLDSKYPPPPGVTGADGVDLTIEQIRAINWQYCNVGLRMPVNVIGFDVDAYRGGMETWRQLCKELGDPPPTWIIHNGRDDGSGIRFYRFASPRFVAGIGGIDVIQRAHRYAVAPPSIHPDGRLYRWFDQRHGTDNAPCPNVCELP